MTVLADLVAKRETLVAIRNTGAKSVKFGSGDNAHETIFRSGREIDAAIAAVDREIAALQGRRVTTFLPSFGKGL